MAQTMETADAVLKEDYHGPVAEQLNTANAFAAQLERNSEDIVGRRAVIPLHVGRNRGVGARAERQLLPAAGAQQYEDIFIPVRSMYVRIELTGQVIKAMRNNKGSFIRALDSEMDGAVTDGKRDYCRQLWGTSDGVIAAVTAGAASTTVALDGPREDQLRHLEDGGLIDIGTVADPDGLAAGVAVRSVDYDAGTIVIENANGSDAAAIAPGAGTIISRHGAFGVSDESGRVNDGQVEVTGLQHIVSDTRPLHTLDPADEPKWAARVYDNGGVDRAISENLVTRAIMQGEIRSGAVVDLLIGGDGVFRAYGNLLTSLKRFTEVTLTGGYTGLKAGTVGANNGGGRETVITWDRDAPNRSLFGLSTKDLVFMEMGDWDWMDRDGAILSRVSGFDAYEAVLYKYGELACRRRNAMFRIDDITEL